MHAILPLVFLAMLAPSVAAQEAEPTPVKAAEPADDYVPYGNHDARKAVIAGQGENGKAWYKVDVRFLDSVFADLARHAANYPVHFASVKERSRAERDVRATTTLFDKITDPETDPEMLLRAARWNAIGYNLDLDGSANQAIGYFKRVLKAKPEHPQGHFHYGVFLASTATLQKKAVKHLEKALELGVEEARYALGMVSLQLGNKDKALEHFETYVANTGDERTVGLIQAIKTAEIQRVESSAEATKPAKGKPDGSK